MRNVTWFAHAREYAHRQWPDLAAKSRVSMVEALMAVTPALAKELPDRPDADHLRKALRNWAFRLEPQTEVRAGRAQRTWVAPAVPAEMQRALDWMEKASLHMSEISAPVHLSRAVQACYRRLDGSAAAPDYASRRRRGFYAALQYAVLMERLPANPLAGGGVPREWRPPKTEDEVDPRSIGNPATVAHVLTTVSYVGRRQGPRFTAWFGCMYYAMMRPEEVADLRRSGCHLPETGWGTLTFSVSAPAAGKQWTDSGTVHEERGLKGRTRKAVRTVPIPPKLVAMLREHIERFGCGPDGRLFRSEQGNAIQPSTYWRVWQRARELALGLEEAKGPLLKRPYDLRHAGVTYRLNSGVPATQVAEWAGHSVDVLNRIYAKVWKGMDDVWIERMGDFV
jgi:integrase